MRIDVGCGRYITRGYVGVDPYYEPVDIKASATELPFEDESVEEVLCIHALEHLSKAEVPLALAEFYRVLKTECHVIILVPDLRWVCRNVLKNGASGWHLDAVFGNQEHEGEYHKTGFSRRTIGEKMYDAGFRDIMVDNEWSHGQESIRAIGFKNSEPTDTHTRAENRRDIIQQGTEKGLWDDR